MGEKFAVISLYGVLIAATVALFARWLVALYLGDGDNDNE